MSNIIYIATPKVTAQVDPIVLSIALYQDIFKSLGMSVPSCEPLEFADYLFSPDTAYTLAEAITIALRKAQNGKSH